MGCILIIIDEIPRQIEASVTTKCPISPLVLFFMILAFDLGATANLLSTCGTRRPVCTGNGACEAAILATWVP